MRAAIFFAFAFLAVLANAQVVERFTIDDFSVAQGQKVTLTITTKIDTNTQSQALRQDSSIFVPGCVGLIGCGRDLRVEVYRGDQGRVFGVDVFTSDKFDFEGEFAIATPKGGRSINYVQWDGGDQSFNLDTNGLPAGEDRDFTDGGLATGIRFSAVSDLDTTYTLQLFTPGGGICTGTVQFPVVLGQDYTRDDINTDLPYSQFTGNCDLTNIGAAQIEIPSADAVDAIIRQVRGIGFPDPSDSPTPSPSQSRTPQPSQSQTPAPSQSQTPAPSNSNTPTPSISISNTPTPSSSRTATPTPSRSGPCIQFCVCPSFTCQIAFDLDDDVNDVVLNPITSQFFFDDSDDVLPPRIVYVDDDLNPDDDRIVYVEVDDDDLQGGQPTFTVPTFTVPTFTIPTFTIPSFTIGTVTFPSITDFTSVPSVSVPSFTFDSSNTNNGSSDSTVLVASLSMILVALVI